jgi:hypothetical protein
MDAVQPLTRRTKMAISGGVGGGHRSVSAAEYKPKFPKAHALLFITYNGLMTAKPEDVSAWAERFNALIKSWRALKEEGVLPPIFTEHFWEDVRNVSSLVHRKTLEEMHLTDQQSELTFGMSNLQRMFGAP